MRLSMDELEQNICEVYLSPYDEISTIIKIIKKYLSGKELFFSCYREDGNFDKELDTVKYRKEIPEYFKWYGRYETIYDANLLKKRKYFDPRIEVIGSLPLCKDTIEYIPNICNYYLETLFFVPLESCTWDVFSKIVHDNPMKRASFYMSMGCSDQMCVHTDSGSFAFVFDKTKLNSQTVYHEIKRICDSEFR